MLCFNVPMHMPSLFFAKPDPCVLSLLLADCHSIERGVALAVQAGVLL